MAENKQSYGGYKMKTIGLIGGMSWESTIPYYRIINEEVKNRLGGLHSAKIILFVHIADATADALEACHIQKAGLLGTKYTMTQDFYKQKLIDRGIDVITPQEADIDIINDIIFHELCVGKIRGESRRKFQAVINSLKDQGAEGVILGCTEIGLLIHPSDSSLPVFDTTRLHARRAVEIALD